MKRAIRAAAAVFTVLAASTVLAGQGASAQSAPDARVESRGFIDNQEEIRQIYRELFGRLEGQRRVLDATLAEANDVEIGWEAIQTDMTGNIVHDQSSVESMADAATELYERYFGAPGHSQRPMTAKKTIRLLKRLAHRADAYRAGQYRVVIADLVRLNALKDKTLEAQLVLEGSPVVTEDLDPLLAAIDDAARATARTTAKTDPDVVQERRENVQEVKNDYREVVPGAVAAVLLDTDGDGLTDLVEASLGTDSTLPDTDGDGVSDGDEVAAGTDPTRPPVVGPCPTPSGACRSAA